MGMMVAYGFAGFGAVLIFTALVLLICQGRQCSKCRYRITWLLGDGKGDLHLFCFVCRKTDPWSVRSQK